VKFHEYRTCYQNRVRDGYPRAMTPADYYVMVGGIGRTMRRVSEAAHGILSLMAATEGLWYMHGGYYYKVWPGVADALFRVKLDRPGPDYRLENGVSLMVRFAVGREPLVGTEGARAKSALVNVEDNKLLTIVEFDAPGREEPYKGLMVRLDEQGRSLDEALRDKGRRLCLSKEDAEGSTVSEADVVRLGLAVMLMRRDPTFVTPDQWDHKAAYDADAVLKERVERAEARGVRGWRVGEAYEDCPHLRRPHLGLRWTGPGKAVPKIVPVKGSVVHRQKLTRVPTGYYDQEGREVEHE